MEFNSRQFKKDVITKRKIDNNLSMDQASEQIGISKATLSRIEYGKEPDLTVFLKVLKWLNCKDINTYFIVPKRRQDGFKKGGLGGQTKYNTKNPQHDAKLPVMQWVAVSENKPEAGQWLLVYAPSGRHIAWYNGFQFEDRADYNIEGVTHWMQIPEPPFA